MVESDESSKPQFIYHAVIQMNKITKCDEVIYFLVIKLRFYITYCKNVACYLRDTTEQLRNYLYL